MTAIAIRRATIASIAVAIAAWLLRPQLASALVVRGDEQLYRARPLDALHYYERALKLNPLDGQAVDRFLFVALTLKRSDAVESGIASASVYLRATDDGVVRFDRAMAYRSRGAFERALADFIFVGRREHNATALTFAGFSAEKLGRRAAAIALWRSALRMSPHWFPAERALKRAELRP